MADITTRGVKFEGIIPTYDGGGYWNYGGSARLSITGDVNVLGSTDLTIPQGRKLSLDGGGHTYITEESDSNLKFYVAAGERLNISNSYATFTVPVRTAKVTTSGNTSLYLQTGGTGHVYIGDSSNGMNLYHYSSADDGVYSSFDWNGNYYRIATTATSGVWVNDPLKVSGIMETEHIKADNVGSGTTIVRPGTDAQWGASGTSTGRVEITLPGTTASSNHGMVYLQIDVYEYGNTNGPTTYWVGGHNWGSGGNWHSVNAYKIGPGSKKLYLGVRNSRYVVLIGDANSSWNYGSVHVSYANNASFYSSNMDMVDGVTSYGSGQWSATLVTHADSAYTNLKSDLATVVEFKDSHIHAERFVDEDATSFYLKPGGTSVLNAATFGGTITVAGATTLNGGLKVNGPASHNTIKSANDYTLGFNDYNDVNQWWIKAYTNGGFALHENGVGDKFTIAAGGNATFAGTVSLPDGNATTPSINNTGDTNTGMYFPGDNQVGFAVDGSRKFYMSAGKAYFQNLSSGVEINAGGLSMSQSSTTDYVLRLTDTGVASYDFTFPDTGTIQLDTDTTSTKTFKITNVGSGEFGLYVGGDSTFTGDVTIQGDLGVTGITTTTNVVNLDLADNIIGLNRGSTSNANDSGIIIERGSTGDNAAFLWDESEDRFMFGTTTANPAATGNISVTNVGIESSTARFTAVANAITISNHGDGNNFLNVNHSGNESWYFKAASASGSTDYIGIGANGGGEFKIYEDGSIDAAGKITSPQRKYCSASISNSYVKIYRAEGASSQLATAVRITGTSHGTGHVGNFTALVMVNHYEDVYIRSDSGAYTQLTLKVESDNNEDYHLSVKSSSANAATYYFTIEALSSEITITTLPTTTPATDTVHEHGTVFGSRETGEGATLYHKVSGEASFDTSITTPKIMGNPYIYIMGSSGTYDGRLKFKPYSGGREWSFGNESSNFRLQDDSAGVTRMWWDYDGKLAINSTNVNYETPGATVDIHAGAGAEMLMLRNNAGLGHYFEAGGSGSARHYIYAMGGGAKIRLDSVGPHSYAAAAIGQVEIDFHANASNLIVGTGSGSQGMTIYTGQNQGDYGSIYFADGRANGLEEYRGMITYEQNNEIMRFHTAGHATPALKLDVNRNATFASNVGIGDAPDENGFGLEIHKDGDDDSIGILIHNKGSDSLDDAKISFETQGQRDISIGIDRSDSFFKISHSGDLGTNDWQTFDGSGNVTFAEAVNIGAGKKIYLGGSTSRMHVYHTGSGGEATVLTKEGNLNLVNQSHGDDIVFKTEDSGGSVIQPLILDSGGDATFSGAVSLADTKYLNWGQNNDFKIHHNGSASYLQNYTGALVIQNNQNDGNIVFQSDDGNGGLFDYFSLDGGSTTYAHSATTAAYTKWQDNSRIALGSGKDLQLYHDGSNSYIKNLTGWLNMPISQNGVSIANADFSASIARFLLGGACELYHNGTKRIETTSAGATITGALSITGDGSNAATLTETGAGILTIATVDALILDSADDITLDAGGNDIRLFQAGTEYGKFKNDSGSLALYSSIQDEDIFFRGNDGGSTITALTLDMSNGGSATFRDDIDLAGSINMTGSSKVIKLNGGGFIDFDSTNLQLNTDRHPNTGARVSSSRSHAHIGLQGADGGSQIIFSTAPNNTSTATTKLTINSAGNAIFAGDVYLNNSASAVLTIGDISETDSMSFFTNNGTTFYMQQDVAGANIQLETDQLVIKKVGASENVAIFAADGAVKLYYNASKKFETTDGGVDCSGYYGFTSTGNDYGFYYGVEPGSTQGIAIKSSDTGGAYFDGLGYFWNNNTGNGAGMFQMQNDGATYCRYINFYRGSNSNIIGYIGYNATNTAVTYSTSSSDERLKKNIVAWSEAVLPKFLSLQPKKFNFKAEVGDPGPEKIKGYIAQNEVANFPEVYQLNGEGDDARYGFHPMEMVPYLMKAVKELVEKNQDLEARIVELEK